MIAVSTPLRRRGLQRGEKTARARNQFPQAEFVLREISLEKSMWRRLLPTLNALSPKLSAVRPGLAFIDAELPAQLETFVREAHIHAGRAPWRTTALFAALTAVPGEVRTVTADGLEAFLDACPLGILHELGPECAAALDVDADMLAKLPLFGFTTLGSVRRLSRRHLQAQFGASGAALFDLLDSVRADSVLPDYRPPTEIRRRLRLEFDACEPCELLPQVRRLLLQAVDELGDLRCGLVTLELERSDGCVATAAKLLKEPTGDADILLGVLRALLPGLLDGQAVDVVVLRLGSLANARFVQERLLDRRVLVDAVAAPVLRRFPHGLKQAEIENPDAYLPEDGVRLRPWPLAVPARR